ncbi:MAG: type II toxin-antitoxin system RelE/ParE family toxin [Rhodospirillaceae bacterium]|nr:type II toxin-antitoxin system RelE/ParE family toxin [Rhodospirillaceae bacterium]
MSLVYLTDAAIADLEDIWVFYSPDLGAERANALVESLADRLQAFAQQPRLGRARPDLGPDLRVYILGEYLAFYVIEKGAITVVRILHGARDVDHEMKK